MKLPLAVLASLLNIYKDQVVLFLEKLHAHMFLLTLVSLWFVV